MKRDGLLFANHHIRIILFACLFSNLVIVVIKVLKWRSADNVFTLNSLHKKSTLKTIGYREAFFQTLSLKKLYASGGHIFL